MLFLRQTANEWYKFDYLFGWEDNMIMVFVNGKLITTQPMYMSKDKFAAGQG